MTTAEVNTLGVALVVAERDGDDEQFRAAAYDLLRGLSIEHERADCLAARVHFLTGGGR